MPTLEIRERLLFGVKPDLRVSPSRSRITPIRGRR